MCPAASRARLGRRTITNCASLLPQRNAQQQTMLINSLIVAAGTTLLAGIVGLMAALWATALESLWRKVFSLLAIISLAMPPFLQTNCWLDLMGITGSLHRLLPLNIYSKAGAISILALLTWPIFFGFGLT